MNLPPLSIVVPVFNGAATLDRCLAALLADAPPGAEVIVVDDGSTDDSAERAARFQVRVLRNARNIGTSATRNRGWRSARADRIAFVDADVVVRPGSLGALMAALDAEPALAGANGLLDLEPGAPGLVSAFVNTSIHFQHLRHGRRVNTTFTSLCLLTRDALRHMHGWDERWRSRYADDVATRFSLPPACLALVPEARGLHLKEVRLRGMVRHRANVGCFFLRSILSHWSAIRTLEVKAVLDRRFPLNTIAAGLAVAALPLLPVLGPAGVLALGLAGALNIAANLGYARFTWHHRGPLEALAVFPLCFAEGLGCFGGMATCAIRTLRSSVPPLARGRRAPT
ncbi:MAG: glycosyltransferase family 2 protein [Alphaproteobacteria bacterium]|nr:glycosyltransferase family 2 protein [Alphaproteobacteria bacterium]